MSKQFIKDLEDKMMVDSNFLISEKNVGIGRNGRPFMSLKIGDRTGYLDGRVWDRVDDLSSGFELGDIVRVKGQIQIYQNRKQIVVHQLDRVDKNTIDLDDYIAKSQKDPYQMFTQLMEIVHSLKNESIKRLILDTIQDPEIKELFLKAPAAKTIHHGWLGGLLEHVLSICQLMNSIATHYDFLNRDLLIFGGIFHDIGKIFELSFDKAIGYTDRGRLLGHMLIACEIIDKKSNQILGFPEDLKDILKHIVLSHHGKLEYGSPKRPKFIEAMVVAMIDDLDSKVCTLHTLIEGERVSGDRWSKYNDLFERYFLIDDLKNKF